MRWELLKSAWEPALLDLFIPLLDPRVGTQGSVQLFEIIAWLEVFALEGMTAMVIDEVLVAMSRLVLIGESGIERRRSEHGELLFGSQFLLRLTLQNLSLEILRLLSRLGVCEGLGLHRHFYFTYGASQYVNKI